MHVSVVIPTYNRPDYLKRLLASIAAQTFRDFEVIIVNDHSNQLEEYEKVVNSFRSCFPKLEYLTNDRQQGAPFSRNRGIRAAQGEFVALVDDDDFWFPTKLEKQLATLGQAKLPVSFIYSWAEVQDEAGKKISEMRPEFSGDLRKEILWHCFVPSPSVIVRRQTLLDLGLFDERLTSCQDWDMWTRIFVAGHHASVVKEVLAVYQQHHTEHSVGTSSRALLGYRRYFRKHLGAAWRYNKMAFGRQLYSLFKIELRLTWRRIAQS